MAIYSPTQHKTLLCQLNLIYKVREAIYGTPALVLAIGARTNAKWSAAKDQYVKLVKAAVERAEMDWSNWAVPINAYAEEQRFHWKNLGTPSKAKSSTGGETAINALVVKHQEPIVAALDSLPRTLEKAANAAAFSLELSNDVPDPYCFPELLTLPSVAELSHVGAFKKTLRQHLLKNELPESPRYWEDEWIVAWVRYAERFEPRNGRKFISDAASSLEVELRDELPSLYPSDVKSSYVPDMLPGLHKAWLLSSSLRLRTQVSAVVSEALRGMLTWQDSEGHWPTMIDGGRRVSCPTTTAFAAACLLVYGDGGRWFEQANRALVWLLSNANSSGGWGKNRIKGATETLDIVVTVTVLEVCRTCGVSLDHPVIAAAESSLLRAQEFTGVWSDYRGYAQEYLTCLVLGYFERREQRTAEMSEATTLGRGLLLKAHALSVSDAPTDSVLALIALYHGLEYTLYGFLLKHEVEIRDGRGETLGVREALGAFERLAKANNWIGKEARVPYRTQLSELAAKRDEVIHRMSRVTPQQVDGFVEQVLAFVSKFGYKALGYSLIN